eukprot:12937246-Prorocentrum_lima.AAC.1
MRSLSRSSAKALTARTFDVPSLTANGKVRELSECLLTLLDLAKAAPPAVQDGLADRLRRTQNMYLQYTSAIRKLEASLAL